MGRLEIRVARLEHGDGFATIGDLLHALATEEVGEVVDWSTVRVSPAPAAAPAQLD
jgi:hypothetical protein